MIQDTAKAIADDWAAIVATLAIKRGEGWEEALPDELHFKYSNGTTQVQFGDDLFYSLDPDTKQVYESRIEDDNVLVSVFDPDGELFESSTISRDAFKIVSLEANDDA